MNELDRLAFMFYHLDQVWDDVAYAYSGDHGDLTNEDDLLETSILAWKEYFSDRSIKHCGDCTNHCCRCLRCQLDEYYEQAQKVLNL